jgi:PTH2 family peptidyl-tRNA hydrolase
MEKESPMYKWLDGPFTKICVSCDSEEELLVLVEKAKTEQILTCLITDSGKTEFNGVPTITCAAFGPEWVEKLDELTKHLKLL